MDLLWFYSWILKVFYVLKENFKYSRSFFNNYCMRYLHSGCLLMRTVVQEMEMWCTVYLSFTALKSWNLSLPRWNSHPINTAKFFGPIGDHINWVPLYQNVMCKIYCVGWFLFMTDLVNTEWHTCISASCRLYAANTALAHPRYYWCKVLFVCFFF